MFSAPAWRGGISDHFDGERFFNPWNRETKTMADLRKWKRERRPAPWPKWVEVQPGPPPPGRVEGGALRVTFVNHATVLLQIDGLNILTDPVWSERASPVRWAGPRRVHAPGLRFEDLPPIDLALLSHNHYDHMDLAALRRLTREKGARILTGLGNSRFLEKKGIQGARDLDWWESAEVEAPGGGGTARITFVPAQHFSARWLNDRNFTLWGGFVIEAPSGGRVYFAGDSGYGPHFREIGERLGPFRLALIPIGAYEPRWFMKFAHVNPQEAVQAHFDVRAERSLGIHFGTFQLTDEPREAPVEGLIAAREAAGLAPGVFRALAPGESWTLSGSEEIVSESLF